MLTLDWQQLEKFQNEARFSVVLIRAGVMMANDRTLVLTDIEMRDTTTQDLVVEIVQRHAQFVYRIAYSVLQNHHDAEDASQETFLRVLRHKGTLSGLLDERAWLARVAWRAALTRRRQRGTPCDNAAEIILALSSSEASAQEIVEGQEFRDILDRLVASLPEDLRDTLVLSTVEGIQSTEIAQILQIPESSVRTRLFRARNILRDKFAKLAGGRNA